MRHYSQAFIHLQMQFAEKLSALLNIDLGETLAEHTVLRHLLAVSISRADQSDPVWQQFVRGCKAQPAPTEWAYAFYQRHAAPDQEAPRPRFGCFTFAYPFRGTPVVRLHFENLTKQSVLKSVQINERKAELRALFAYVRQHHPEAKRVRGGSWLYNIAAYRRLFPDEYIKTAEGVGYETGFFALWGQFLRADGDVHMVQAAQFLTNIERQTTEDGCLHCFPYEVLRPECSIEVFNSFYSI